MSSTTRKLKRKRGWGSKPYNYCCKTEMLEKPGVGYICQCCGRFKRYQEALRGECKGK